MAKASSVRSVSLLFTFLVPVLNDCVPLLDVYHNCSETMEIVLSFLLDVVECQLTYLSKVGVLTRFLSDEEPLFETFKLCFCIF